MNRINLSGILIFLSFVTSMAAYFFYKELLLISGILVWIAFALLFESLKSKKFLIILFILSFFVLLICLNGFRIVG